MWLIDLVSFLDYLKTTQQSKVRSMDHNKKFRIIHASRVKRISN